MMQTGEEGKGAFDRTGPDEETAIPAQCKRFL